MSGINLDRDIFLRWLDQVAVEMKNYYPDDDSKQAGYSEAIRDVLDKLKELDI